MVYVGVARAPEITLLVQRSNDSEGVRLKRFLLAVALLWLMAIGSAWSETTEWSKNIESGTAAYKQGRYTEAERAFSLAVKEAEQFGPEDMRLATSLTHLARTYYALGKYAEAESLYRRALAMQEKVLGPDSKEVALTLGGLAQVCFAPHVYKQMEADPLLKRAAAIQEKTLGPDHPDLATTLDLQGQLYLGGTLRLTDDPSQLEAADSFFKRALAIQQKALGPEHLDVATTLDGMAQGLAAYAWRNEAIADGKFAEPLPVSIFIRGPLRSEARKKYEAAEKSYKQALAIREQALGPQHPDVAATLEHYAELLHNRNRDTEAEPFYKRALAIREQALGPEHPDVAWTLLGYALVLRGTNRSTEAEKMEARGKAILVKH